MEGLLQYIDQIDQSVFDSEMNVMESMLQSYDKSIMILENCDDETDISAFDIFQEGERWEKFKKDTEAPILGNKGENIIKRILMIIPRLIQKLFVLVRKLFTRNKSVEQTMDRNVQQLKQNGQQVVAAPLTPEQMAAIKEEIRRANEDSTNKIISELKQNLDAIVKSASTNTPQPSSPGKAQTSTKSVDEALKEIDKKNPELINQALKEAGAPPRKMVKLEDVVIDVNGLLLFQTSENNGSVNVAEKIFISNQTGHVPKIAPEHVYFKNTEHVKQYIGEVEKYMNRIDIKMGEINQNKTSRLRVQYKHAVTVMEFMRKTYVEKFKPGMDAHMAEINKICEEFKKQLAEFRANQNEPSTENEIVMSNFAKAFGFDDPTRSYGKSSEYINLVQQYIVKLDEYVVKLNQYVMLIGNIWNKHFAVLQNAMKLVEKDSKRDNSLESRDIYL